MLRAIGVFLCGALFQGTPFCPLTFLAQRRCGKSRFSGLPPSACNFLGLLSFILIASLHLLIWFALLLNCAPHSPFLQKQKFLQIRVRYRKSAVLLARNIYFSLRESRKRDAAIRLISEKTRGRAALPLTACFLSLRSSQQGDGEQAARYACRQALVHLLLLIPKNLTPLRALRFSGAPLFRALLL